LETRQGVKNQRYDQWFLNSIRDFIEDGEFEPPQSQRTDPCKTVTRPIQNMYKTLQYQTLAKNTEKVILAKALQLPNRTMTISCAKSVLYVCTKIYG